MTENEDKEDTALELTGGEPTEHPDIERIFEEAVSLGYEEIGINSNGRNFSNEKFTEKLVSLGLMEARISLHGPEKIHNMISGTDSFRESMAGVKNLKKNGVAVSVDSVLMSVNIEHIPKLHEALLEVGVDRIGVADLLPPSQGKETFAKLSTSYAEKKRFFIDNAELLKKFSMVCMINFPYCVSPNRPMRNFVYLTPYAKQTDIEFGGGKMLGAEYDSVSKKTKVCEDCAFSSKCFGFFNIFLNQFGEEDVDKMMKMDDFINQHRRSQ